MPSVTLVAEPLNRNRSPLPPEHDPLVGVTLADRYRIIRVLARGGMGVVYLARTEGAAGFAKPVVVKRMLTSKPSAVVSFIREARVMSQLSHPNIVKIIDFHQVGETYFMILDYVRGYDLSRWNHFGRSIERPVPLDFALSIVISVLEALHHVHTSTSPGGEPLAIIHRDVSPSNILLDSAGRIHLTDFGIARMREDVSGYRTQEIRIKGKLSYLAPELLAGAEPSAATDVYSTALVLHELLLGRNDFRAKTPAAIISRVLGHAPTLLSEARVDVSPVLGAVVDRALSKSVTDRCSAAELLAALLPHRRRPSEEIAVALGERLARDFADPRFLEMTRAKSLDDLERSWRHDEPEPRAETIEIVSDSSMIYGVADTADFSEDDEDLLTPTRMLVPAVPRPRPRSRAGVWLLAALIAGGLALAAQHALQPREEPPPLLVVHDRSAGERETIAGPAKAIDPAKSATRAIIPERATTSGERPTPSLSARLTRAFAKNRAEIESCYAQNTETPGSGPRLSVDFEIDARGQVLSAAISPPALADTSLGRCIAAVARGASFGHQSRPLSFRIPVVARAPR